MPINSTIMKMMPPVVAVVKLDHIFSRSAVKASIVSGPVERVVPWLAMKSLRRHRCCTAFYDMGLFSGKGL